MRTSDRSDLFSSSSSLSFFCRESTGKKVGVDTLFSLGRTLQTQRRRHTREMLDNQLSSRTFCMPTVKLTIDNKNIKMDHKLITPQTTSDVQVF